jgi:hypothetical protein
VEQKEKISARSGHEGSCSAGLDACGDLIITKDHDPLKVLSKVLGERTGLAKLREECLFYNLYLYLFMLLRSGLYPVDCNVDYEGVAGEKEMEREVFTAAYIA